MLRLNLCPHLVLYSFSVVFVIIIFIFFWIQLAADGLTEDNERIKNELLPINYDKNLTSWFSLKFDKIRDDFQIYRFFTGLFIHLNFWHFLTNSIMIIIWTSYFEVFLTLERMPVLFFLSGMIGNVFATAMNSKDLTTLGSSTGIFGIIGSAIGYLIFNWYNLNYKNSPKYYWMVQVIFIAVLSFLFTGSGVRNMAHVGGFLSGIFIGMIFCKKHTKSDRPITE